MARRDLSKPLAASTFGEGKRRVVREKAVQSSGDKVKTKKVYHKNGQTGTRKTKVKGVDGSKYKSKHKGNINTRESGEEYMVWSKDEGKQKSPTKGLTEKKAHKKAKRYFKKNT